MVSPVRIRVPPLPNYLQIAERQEIWQCCRNHWIKACQQPDRERASTTSAATAELCIPSATRVWMVGVILLAGDLLLEYPLVAVRQERVVLRLESLVLPRHPCVYHPHTSIVPKSPRRVQIGTPQ